MLLIELILTKNQHIISNKHKTDAWQNETFALKSSDSLYLEQVLV